MYGQPRNIRALIVLVFLAVAPVVASAETFNVYPDGKTGFATIQTAVDATRDGDVVVLHEGTYTGLGNCDIDLRGKAITIQGAAPEDPGSVAATIIDCQAGEKTPHRGFYVVGSFGATISGLTITNGLASMGGAVYCESSDLTLTHCRIVGNAALAGGDGGGVYAASSILRVSGCVINDNSAGAGVDSAFSPGQGGDGGGIYADSLQITDSSVVGNTAGRGGAGSQAADGGDGGGIYCARASISTCIIEGNVAGAGGDSTFGEKGFGGEGGSGGGVFCADSLEMTNSLVAGNRCGLPGLGFTTSLASLNGIGGGISCSSAVIDHCTIVSNSSGEEAPTTIGIAKIGASTGGGVAALGQVSLSNSIVWDNTPDQLLGLDCALVSYCDIDNGNCPAEQGNISLTPGFVQTGYWTRPGDPTSVWVSGDYRLTTDSPCADAGDPDYPNDPNETDLGGGARVAGEATDIGAYELESLVPVYRFVSLRTGKHFYTADAAEAASLRQQPDVWTSEGVAYMAYGTPTEPGLQPVYRFWSDVLSSHFWTISEAEKDLLIAKYPDAWTYEGPVFYAYPEGSQPADAKPIYRFWSGTFGAHFYTINEAEKERLIKEDADIWTFEGVVWYAYDAESTEPEPPTAQAGTYDFTCTEAAASCELTLKAYLDGREVTIGNPSIAMEGAFGHMEMVVDFDAMTSNMAELQLMLDLAQHTTLVSDSQGTGGQFPLTLSLFGVFESETARGPWAIDPQTLTFSTLLGGSTSIGDETLQIVGSANFEGEKYDVDLQVAPTLFEASGSATFDDSSSSDLLEMNMDGPFQWRRQGQEDLLFQADIKGHQVQIYVTSAQVRTTGLWEGKNQADETKTVK